MAIRSSAQVAIHTASVAAATVSASPIPFSDAALLVPIQTTMITAIYKAYGREISEGIIKGAVTATTASAFAKSLIGNVIKMVPILGTAAGSVLNAGVAVGFTEAIGFSIANAFENDKLDNTDDLMNILKDTMHTYKK
jgi:uncharacterized protein (DUF697 family)